MDFFGRHNIDSILNACLNIFNLQLCIVVLDDSRERKPLSHKFKHALDGNSGSRDAWLPKMNPGASAFPVPCDGVSERLE